MTRTVTRCILYFRFIDHLMVMFEELPPWDVEEKYIPSELEVGKQHLLFVGLVLLSH